MNSYSVMPMIYDRLMQNVDYKNWADFIDKQLKEAKAQPMHHILELGCGTGNVTKELLELGYEVVGIDISDEMLDVAREKLEDYGDKIILVAQDICKLDFEVYEIDVVACCNDTFNYILNKSGIEKLLNYLHPRIKQGGILIFDISSSYKLKNILGNNTFGESFNDMVYLWENYYNEEEKVVTMDINFFVKDGKTYQRYGEEHRQKAHEVDEIVEVLEKVGFKNLKLFGDFSRIQGLKENSQRIFFVCEK